MSRLWFTLGALVIYRLGKSVPLPGLDPLFVRDMMAEGKIARISIFVIGISPYITASLLILVLNSAWRGLRRRKDALPRREKGLDAIARFAALVLAAIQGCAIASVLVKSRRADIWPVGDLGLLFEIMVPATITAATGILIWLANQITQRGLGNGVGLILLSDLTSQLPRSLGSLLEEARIGLLSPGSLIFLGALAAVVTAVVVFIESGRRLVRIDYAPRLLRATAFSGASSSLRLKLNSAGVIPPIFASWLLLVSATTAGLSADPWGWLADITGYIGRGHPLHFLLYAGLIIVLSLFYTAMVFNPAQAADDLRQYGGVVPGIRPGKDTADHLRYVLTRLTVAGSLYLSGVCLLPELLTWLLGRSIYFSGIRLLVILCISLDLVGEVRARLGRSGPLDPTPRGGGD